MARRLRCFVENQFYEVTDRTLGELYRLMPSADVNAILEEALRVAMSFHPEVGVLGFTVMSNHWHLLLRAGPDPTGISRFMQVLKSLVAKELNDLQDGHDTFWSKRFSDIAVLDEDTALERLLYFATNPSAAGLCGRFEEWPGLSTAGQLLGVRTACGDLGFEIELLPSWQCLGPEQLAEKRRQLLIEVRAREACFAEERKRRGLGRPQLERMLKRLTHEDRPRNPKRGPLPLCFASTLAAKDAFRAQMKWFARAYAVASEKFRAGVLDVEFPARALPPRLMRPPVEASA